MKIIGDITTANKFYISRTTGGILWVPKLSTAKAYVLNPKATEWYGKTIYATNEEVVLDNDGTYTLKSNYVKTIPVRTLEDEYNTFVEQVNAHIDTELTAFATAYGYTSISTMVSWKNSTVEKYNEEAEMAIAYRDEVYAYSFDKINSFKDAYEETELNEIYRQYLEGFPTYDESE